MLPYDNNPLITLALVFLFSLMMGPLNSTMAARKKFLLLVPAGGCVAIVWWSLISQVKTAMDCTETWPEVSHLAGARLRPKYEKMRDLVRLANLIKGKWFLKNYELRTEHLISYDYWEDYMDVYVRRN